MNFLRVTEMEKYLANPQKAYAEDEAFYEAEVQRAAQMILDKKTVKMVFVSGPSCAGKTPTTERLAHYLKEHGVKTELISLDDFYRHPQIELYHPDGTPDYESPESLDLELMHKCFTALCEGKVADMPKFLFKEKRRSEVYTKMRLDEDELCIVEGLHALNPDICGSYIDPAKTFKVYLNAVTDIDSEPRLLRRIVRDYYKRSSTAEQTLAMWENVENGSRKYIYPYKDDADVFINTYIKYERFVMRNDGLRMLYEVPETSPCYEKAKELIDKLLPLPSLPKEAIQPQSFMREFITQRT